MKSAVRRPLTRGDNELALYLANIGKTPLLTREGEVRLGETIRVGWQSALRELFGTRAASLAALELGEQLANRTERLRAVITVADNTKQSSASVRKDVLSELSKVQELERCYAELRSSKRTASAAQRRVVLGRLRRNRLAVARVLHGIPFTRRAIGQLVDALGRASEQREGTRAERAEVAAAHMRVKNALHSSEAARWALVEANLRLVISIASRYKSDGVTFSDLVQEGHVGLMTATEKFDHTRGYKFSTYATWWIRQAIVRCIAEKSRIVRMPCHAVEDLKRVRRTAAHLSQELGRSAELSEIAEALELPLEHVTRLLRHPHPISFETPLGTEGDSTLSDLVADDDAEDPSDAVTDAARRRTLSTLLSGLADRERRVIELRFGLAGRREHTLDEIGKEFGVTRERIRQIEARVLDKLRQDPAVGTLAEFLDK